MGIREMVLERAKKEGLKKGLERGMEKGLEKGMERGREAKSFEVVKNLIERMNLTDDQAADIAGVSVDFVKKVRKKLKK